MTIKRINNLLLAAIITINTYIIVLPFWPALQFWLETRDTTQQVALEQKIQPAAPGPANVTVTPDQQARLIIPSILVDKPFFEGSDISTLNKGFWLRPNSSPPDAPGNTVIAGHRFGYSNPAGTFYHLDKVKVGDSVGVIWHNQKYLYKVVETKTVPASATEIEAPTEKSQLTLYTCTPLWHPTDRLVVIAKPEQNI